MRSKLSITIAALAQLSCFAQAPVQLKLVKNSPFSAQVVTQFKQTLTDGNLITRQSTASIARDSDGRTRREESSVVFIQDPVAELEYILESNSRLARKISAPNAEAAQPAVEIKSIVPTDLKRESLGSQLIEGVQADGTRISRTIPAGQSGNEFPLVVSTETWYSSDLQTIVMSKTLDPRLGETVYKLTNIERTEPSRRLFEVPSEYTVKEEPRRARE